MMAWAGLEGPKDARVSLLYSAVKVKHVLEIVGVSNTQDTSFVCFCSFYCKNIYGQSDTSIDKITYLYMCNMQEIKKFPRHS